MLAVLQADLQRQHVQQNDQTIKLTRQVEDLAKEYKLAQDAAKTGTPEEKSAFETYQKALASALPGVTQGTLAAVAAFQKQPPDTLAGSAAVMDICSSLSSALGGLSTAGGPPGAVLGALFSMVSMILTFFAPKPPSLISQIEALMRDLQAELEESAIRAGADAVRVFAEGCDYLMQPLEGGAVRSPVGLTEELKKFNLVEGNTITTMRTVRHWLLQAGNQNLDAWPLILQLHNDAYMHLTMTVTRLKLYAHDAERIKKYVGAPDPDPVKVKEWSTLQVEADVKFQNLKVNNTLASEFFNDALPIARKRGTYAIAFDGDKIYVVTGPWAFQTNKFTAVFNNTRSMSLTRPRQGVNSPSAAYDLWVLDSGSGRYLYHNRLNVRKRDLTDYEADYVGDPQGYVGQQFLDITATQSPDGTYVVYGTRNYAQGGALEAHTWNRDARTLVRQDWRPLTGTRLLQVRLATPLAVLPDDPEKDDMPPDLLQAGLIIYGTMEDSREIFVQTSKQFAVPIPMGSYTGIAVDSTFLWAYGRDGFVCATHASVMSCTAGKRSMPRWLGPPDKFNLSRVIDLSACEDGTLLISTPERLATTTYHVDFATPNIGEGQRLTVGAWEDFVGGNAAAHVQKLPMYGWPLLEHSMVAVAPR